MGLRLAFLTRIQRPFNGDTVAQEPLGGTQSSMIYLAQELAVLGHEVHIFCHCGPRAGCFQNVHYHPVQELVKQSRNPWDVFVAVADEAALKLGIKAHQTIWWSHNDYAYLWHDQSGLRQEIGALLRSRADKIFAVSDWQAQRLAKLFELPLEHFYCTRNGVHWPYFNSGEPLKTDLLSTPGSPLRLLYTSVPDRGLDVLLQLFPRIQAAVQQKASKCPEKSRELELHLYSSFKVWGQQTDADATLEKKLEIEAHKLPGVFFHEPLTHAQLAQELKKATLWLYPNHSAPSSGFWAETSCIAALEAQAAGLPVLSSARGALPESVIHSVTGLLFEGEAVSSDYQAQFVEAAAALLLNTEQRQQMALAAQQHIYTHHRWSEIAAEWSEYLTAFSSTRSAPEQSQAESKAKRPELSVILPVCDRPEHLRLCLDSLRQQDLPDFEIVVLDNHPTAPLEALITEYTQSLNIRYHHRPWPEFNVAQARNAGAQLSRGRVLVFLDADLMVPTDFLSTHLQLQNQHTGRLFSNYIYQQMPHDLPVKSLPLTTYRHKHPTEIVLDLRAHQSTFESPQAPDFKAVSADLFRAAAFSIRRSDLRHSGGFDPEFTGWGHEDLDFALRQLKAGLKIHLLDRRCLHLHHAPATTQPEQERHSNWLRLTRRHGTQDTAHRFWSSEITLPVFCTDAQKLLPAVIQAQITIENGQAAPLPGELELITERGILTEIRKKRFNTAAGTEAT